MHYNLPRRRAAWRARMFSIMAFAKTPALFTAALARASRRLVCPLLALALAGACGGPAPGPVATPSRARNVLLITIDTLRADAVGAYSRGAARTPAIDAVAARGTLVEHAYATAPITLTSHASLLTGLYPPGHGSRHNGIAPRADVATLAERFRQAGARTAAFVSAFPLDRSFGLTRGFEVYSDRMPRGPDGRLANERPGRTTVDEALAWLHAHRAERFFLWVHLFEPHAPYGDPADGRPPRDRYASEVAEADRQVQRLLDVTAPTAADTLVVIAGDHGEAFGEHGEVAHSIFVYDTTLRVPLIFAGPGVGSGQTRNDDVSLVDLAPTVARLAALPSFSPTDGRALDLDARSGTPPAGAAPAIYAESFAPLLDFGWSSLRVLRSGRWKYIAAPHPELYDIQSDPGEEHNVITTHRGEADALADRVARFSGPELPTATARASDDTLRRLQALGYVSGSGSREAATRRDPKDARALAAQIALVTSGELTGADLERALGEILRLDRANPQANLRLAYVRIGQRRCAEALPLLERAIAARMPGADPYLGLATCQGNRGDVRAALASLEQARVREPENPVVLANIGIALASLHESRRAVAALTDALAIDPDLHEARFNLALVYARAGDRAAARQQAEELLRRLPPNAPQRSEVERLARAVGE